MRLYVLGDQPSEEEANAHRYRAGMLWTGGYKPGLLVGEKPMLEHLVDAARDAGFDPIILTEQDQPKKILGKKAIYMDGGHSLGDKIRFLQQQSGSFAVATSDLVATRKDMNNFASLVAQHEDKTVVMPFADASTWVEQGLRDKEWKRMYRVLERQGDKHTSHKVAFPQIWRVWPERIWGRPFIECADPMYMNRNDGVKQNYTSLVKTVFARPQALPRVIGTTMLMWASKLFHGLPIGTREGLTKTLLHFASEPQYARAHIAIGDWKSLAYDVDTKKEYAIVNMLYSRGQW